MQYHLIDAAVMVQALWRNVFPATTRELYCSLVNATETETVAWLMFLAGLHDLGKATPGFQGQSAPQRARLERAGWVIPPGAARAHDVLGLLIVHGFLQAEPDGPDALDLATAVAAHHGVPVGPEPSAAGERHMGNHRWGEARAELFVALAGQCDLGGEPRADGEPRAGIAPQCQDTRIAERCGHAQGLGTEQCGHAQGLGTEQCGHAPARMPAGLARPQRALLPLLGGLVRVADWLASQHEAFDRDVAEHEYARLAQARAEEALATADWGQTPPQIAEFREVFGFPPNVMQQRVTALAGPVMAPALVLIEAPTGSGKTEAALHLARVWERHSDQRGSYVALPTQATAAAMHERIRQYPGLREGQLCHGAAPAGGAAPLLPGPAGKLLERHGVGTVDQALLAVLSDRQAWVRLLGLANKTVIIDEVHAYDAYMSGLLHRLLQWLAVLNCSVVMLSATLPTRQRAELLRAYGAPEAGPLEIAYPRVTLATPSFQQVVPLPADPQRRIGLRRMAPDEDLAGRMAEALRDGGCAAVVCNTVARAQRLFLRLERCLGQHGVAVDLLHARYPQAWRQARELGIMRRFGKDGERPHKAVLVATQVVEQSLDLDFDLVISEPAPMDVLLQRAGRLHRHERPRPERLRAPELWLLQPRSDGPSTGSGPVGDGLPDFGASGAVYDEYVLLRTWQHLVGAEGQARMADVTLPQDTEWLIEACYGEAGEISEGPLSTRLTAARGRLAARLEAQEYAALRNACAEPEGIGMPLRPGVGACAHWPDLPALEVVCLQRDGRGYRPASCGAERASSPALPDGGRLSLTEVPPPETVAALLAHAVPLRGYELVEALVAQPQPPAFARHEALRALTPLVLDDRLQAHVGEARITLDARLGLVIEEGWAAG